MKRRITRFVVLLVGIFLSHQVKAQSTYIYNQVADRMGNIVPITSIAVNDTVRADTGTVVPNVPNSYGSGYFQLYFEPGSGLDDVNDAANVARAKVLSSVFSELSSFIVSPLTSGGVVNVWVRDYHHVAQFPGVAYGSSYFMVPHNQLVSGIADNTSWLALNSGVDPYLSSGTASWLKSSSTQTAFHIVLAFDFDNNSWHIDPSSNPSSGEYDFYTVALRELTHALGVHSLLNSDGSSILGADSKFYSRFDSKLTAHSGGSLIANYGTTNMAGVTFCNPVIASSILTPDPLNCIPDSTNCDTSVYYRGSVSVPVYTPNCYEPGFSFSCLEDQCYGTLGNNNYFSTSNSTNKGMIKRYPTDEEMAILNDLGYTLLNYYGSSECNSYYEYAMPLNGATVFGVSDGFDANGDFVYKMNSDGLLPFNGTNLSTGTPGLLDNDINADGFKDIQIIKGRGKFNVYEGGTTTDLIYTPDNGESGIVQFSYVPVNTTTGEQGNITSAIAFIAPPTCDTIHGLHYMCLTDPSIVLTTAVTGTWSVPSGASVSISGSSTGTSCTFIPVSYGTATITFTRTGCAPVYFNVTVYPCNCANSQSGTGSLFPVEIATSGTLTVGDIALLNNTAGVCNFLMLAHNITVSVPSLTIQNTILTITPGRTITINSGSKVSVISSHLFCCANMWQGFRLSGTAQLEMYQNTTGVNNLIEDAQVAVQYSYPSFLTTFTGPIATMSTSAPPAINPLNFYCTNTTFNKNKTAISIDNISVAYTSLLPGADGIAVPCYPFFIAGTIITARDFSGYTTLPVPCTGIWPYKWPNMYGGGTGIGDLVTTTSTSPYPSPYRLPTLFIATNCNDGNPAKNGMFFKNVGITPIMTHGTEIYTGLFIGNTQNIAGTGVLIDGMQYGISDTNTNLTVRSTDFTSCSVDGIRSESFTQNSMGTNKLHLYGFKSASGYSNDRFYSCGTGVEGINLYELRSRYTRMYSNLSTTSASGPEGQYGFKLSAYFYYNYEVHYDTIFNIRNGIVFNTTSISGGGTNLYGQLRFSKNAISAPSPGTTYNEFVQTGISVNNTVGSLFTSWTQFGSQINLDSNRLINVYNGILTKNLNCPTQTVTIEADTIQLMKDNISTGTSILQYGVSVVNSDTCYIDNNRVLGPGASGTGTTNWTMPTGTSGYNINSSILNRIEGFHIEASKNVFATCNYNNNTNLGFYFTGICGLIQWADNSMNSNAYGFVLNTSIGQQPFSPAIGMYTNNSWAGSTLANTWSTSLSYTTLSKMDVNSSVLSNVPTTNFINLGATGYTSTGSSPTILLHSTWLPAPCSSPLWHPRVAYRGLHGNTDIDYSLQLATLRGQLFDGIDVNTLAHYWNYEKSIFDDWWKDSTNVDTGGVIEYFAVKATNSRFQYVRDLEAAFSSGNMSTVQSLLSVDIDNLALSDTDSITGVIMYDGSDVDFIIRNYQTFYSLLMLYQANAMSSDDYTQLTALATKCPDIDGKIVYAARALYAQIFNDLHNFAEGDCAYSTSSRSVAKNSNQEYFLFPNPNNGNMTLLQQFPEAMNTKVAVYNASGSLVFTSEIQFVGGRSVVDCNGLPPGLYVLKFVDAKGENKVHKFNVE